MQNRSPARRVFTSLIRRPDPQVPLAEAALAIAWEDRAGPDPRPVLAQLDAFAALTRPAIEAAADGPTRAAALGAVLAGQLGFRGDPACYERPDPANSFLDEVIVRRSGLPILLSLIYLEVGWRLGLPLHGLALPGHFLVRLADPAGDLFIDPFRRGTLWSAEDCERQITSFYGSISPELAAMIMAPPGRGAILARILRNLKQTYMSRAELVHALAAVERLMLLDASDPGELRDRGLLRLRVGRVHPALEDLERYARENPAATDLAELRGVVRELMARLAPLN